MLTRLNSFIKSVIDSIEAKTSPSSISRFNVGDRLEDVAKVAFTLQEVVPSWKYSKDERVRDSLYDMYIAKLDNVLGSELADNTKWAKIGGGSSGNTPYKQTITCDGVETSYVITHNKNNAAPLCSLSADSDGAGGAPFFPKPVTDGVEFTTLNTATLNVLAYDGNALGKQYYITFL